MSAHTDWLKARAQMGHDTGLMIDACQQFGREVVARYLEAEMFDDIEHALSCHAGEHDALWASLEEFAKQYAADNGAQGVGS